MSDRELLEWAAKAAELKEFGWMANTLTHVVNNQFVFWEPLTDDGDALRLAVKLGLRIYIYPGAGDDFTVVAGDELTNTVSVRESHGSDPYAATRLAIVRAVASIGQQMEK